MKKFYAVQYGPYVNIQDGPFYGDNNILDCEEMGEEIAVANGQLIARLLNEHYQKEGEAMAREEIRKKIQGRER